MIQYCRGRGYAAFVGLLLAAMVAVPLFSQDSPPDPNAPFRVGYAALSYRTLAPEFRYIATTVPRLLLEPVAAITSHRLSRDERNARATLVMDSALSLAIRAVHSSVQQRDRLFFDPSSTELQRQSADDTLHAARETLTATKATTMADLQIPMDVPIELWDGNRSGRLLEAVVLDPAPGQPGGPAALANQFSLDLLVWGSVEEIQGYLAVDFYVFTSATGQSELVGGTIARAEDIAGEADFVAADLAETLLGRAWGTLRVETDVSDALIYVDSELVGFGSAQLNYLEPRTMKVGIEADGYRSVLSDIVVAPDETATVSINLVPTVVRSIRLESAPAGANVYLDSVWRGTTPLTVPHDDAPVIVRLQRTGYLDSRFVVNQASPERITRALLPDTVDWGAEIREKRDGFYGAFSWFVISVPVAMLLNGAYQNVYAAFPRVDGGQLTVTERTAFAQLGNIFYWSYLGAVLVSGGLLVNTVISLVEYIAVGEGAHYQ